MVLRRDPEIAIRSKKFGTLHLTLMECDKTASSDMKGNHFLHFIAHDRTVHSQSLDGKLGLKTFGESNDRVFHGIIRGDYLDANVNQERTAFSFEDAKLEEIVNDLCFQHIERFLHDAIITT